MNAHRKPTVLCLLSLLLIIGLDCPDQPPNPLPSVPDGDQLIQMFGTSEILIAKGKCEVPTDPDVARLVIATVDPTPRNGEMSLAVNIPDGPNVGVLVGGFGCELNSGPIQWVGSATSAFGTVTCTALLSASGGDVLSTYSIGIELEVRTINDAVLELNKIEFCEINGGVCEGTHRLPTNQRLILVANNVRFFKESRHIVSVHLTGSAARVLVYGDLGGRLDVNIHIESLEVTFD